MFFPLQHVSLKSFPLREDSTKSPAWLNIVIRVWNWFSNESAWRRPSSTPTSTGVSNRTWWRTCLASNNKIAARSETVSLWWLTAEGRGKPGLSSFWATISSAFVSYVVGIFFVSGKSGLYLLLKTSTLLKEQFFQKGVWRSRKHTSLGC